MEHGDGGNGAFGSFAFEIRCVHTYYETHTHTYKLTHDHFVYPLKRHKRKSPHVLQYVIVNVETVERKYTVLRPNYFYLIPCKLSHGSENCVR